METKRSLAYLRSKKKVETLKGFYSHLAVFIVVNTILIFINTNILGSGPTNFGSWGNYATLFFWGIGLVSHAIYVFFVLNVQNNFLKRWEEKKINQFLEEEQK